MVLDMATRAKIQIMMTDQYLHLKTAISAKQAEDVQQQQERKNRRKIKIKTLDLCLWIGEAHGV